MFGCQCGRSGGPRRTHQRSLEASQRIACRGVVQNLNCRRAGEIAGPVGRKAGNPFDAALINLTTKMCRQGNNAGSGIVGVAKEITGRVYGFTRGVATVCCLHRFKNALTVLIYCLLNRRAGDNVKDRRCCQALFPCACLGLRCNDVLHPGRVVYSV